MAVVQNPLIGRAKGSIGFNVFSTWKGKNVVRLKALEVSYSNTPEQARNRALLKYSAKAAKNLREIIQKTLKGAAIGKTEYNVLVQRVRPFITLIQETNALLEYSKIPDCGMGNLSIAGQNTESVNRVGATYTIDFQRAFTAAEVSALEVYAIVRGETELKIDNRRISISATNSISFTLDEWGDVKFIAILLFNTATKESIQFAEMEIPA